MLGGALLNLSCVTVHPRSRSTRHWLITEEDYIPQKCVFCFILKPPKDLNTHTYDVPGAGLGVKCLAQGHNSRFGNDQICNDLFICLFIQVSTWFANARRRLKKENKVTWSPRANKSSDERGCDDDSDSAEGSQEEEPIKSEIDVDGECMRTIDLYH